MRDLRRVRLAFVALEVLAACSIDSRSPDTQQVLPVQPGGAGGSPPSVAALAGAAGNAPSSGGANGEGPPVVSPPASGAAGALGPVAPPVAVVLPGADAGSAGVTVSGRVIDFFRHPLADVPVTIGEATALTNAQGQFAIRGVEGPYTASLTLTYQKNNAPAHFGYVYEGLTRSDPTLQVYAGAPEHSGDFTVSVSNADFSDRTRKAVFAFTSPDGSSHTDLDAETTTFGVPWTGPATTVGAAHVLLVLRSDTFEGDPPLAYEAHRSSTLAVQEGSVASASYDLSPSALAVANLGGVVSGGTASDRRNFVSLRFVDGAILPLIDDNDQPRAFSYLLPRLPESAVSFAAATGFDAPYAVVHRENLDAAQIGIALAIPNPVTLSSPGNGAVVTPSTPFTWSGSSQTARSFVWHLAFTDTNDGMFVITNRTQITLPQFADGFSVPPNTNVYWSVETHGEQTNVDALAGPDGFLDSFALGSGFPQGPNVADGYFTESERRDFTVGP
jgi:hypothetical protein